MSAAHVMTLAVHIVAGSLALLLGVVLLTRGKGTPSHRRWGRVLGGLACVVCASATLALVLFGYQSLFAVLTLTVAYQIWGGWRAARLGGEGPGRWDGWMTLLVAIACGVLWASPSAWTVPSLGALAWLVLVLLYDIVRLLFPRYWFVTLWRYEHAAKWIACVSGMASAMLGNVWRSGQPWSQLLPSVAGVLLIVWTCVQLWRVDRALHSTRWQDRRIASGVSP